MARASRLARWSGRAGASGIRLTDKGDIALDQIVTFGRPVFCGNATLAAQPLPHQARLDVAPAASGKSYDNALVGAGEQRRRHFEAERMRRGETPGIRDGWSSD